MSPMPFSIQVPATTANLGPGFDSVGIALNLFMTVDVLPSTKWQVVYEGEEFQELVTDESNLIVETILNIAHLYEKQPTPLELKVSSNIPLGKGFGSSASAIAAGIVIADHLFQLNFTDAEKVRLGTKFEGHADNVSAALLGGVVINYFDGETVDFIHAEEVDASFIVLIPPAALKTTEARNLLPSELTFKDAVKGSSASAVLAAALMQNDWAIVGKMMSKDQFHEAFRKPLFPHFDEIRKTCEEAGAYGMTISGAGPSLIVAVKDTVVDKVLERLREKYDYYQSIAVKASTKGAAVKL